VIQVDGAAQIVTAADPWVIGYAAEDGRELWRAECLQADVGPSPTFADGIVFVANEFPGAAAIRSGGAGNITDSHLLWEADWGAPDCCTPLATDGWVLLVASYGVLTCYDAEQGGDPLWEEELDATFVASPVMAGGYLYLFDEEGKVWISKATKDGCEPVAELTLGEGCVTTPAFLPGRLIIRGAEHLFCLGNP
jgi:outer membrane protein assembly factor BamB